jgi:hypothetical protein
MYWCPGRLRIAGVFAIVVLAAVAYVVLLRVDSAVRQMAVGGQVAGSALGFSGCDAGSYCMG